MPRFLYRRSSWVEAFLRAISNGRQSREPTEHDKYDYVGMSSTPLKLTMPTFDPFRPRSLLDCCHIRRKCSLNLRMDASRSAFIPEKCQLVLWHVPWFARRIREQV